MADPSLTVAQAGPYPFPSFDRPAQLTPPMNATFVNTGAVPPLHLTAAVSQNAATSLNAPPPASAPSSVPPHIAAHDHGASSSIPQHPMANGSASSTTGASHSAPTRFAGGSDKDYGSRLSPIRGLAGSLSGYQPAGPSPRTLSGVKPMPHISPLEHLDMLAADNGTPAASLTLDPAARGGMVPSGSGAAPGGSRLTPPVVIHHHNGAFDSADLHPSTTDGASSSDDPSCIEQCIPSCVMTPVLWVVDVLWMRTIRPSDTFAVRMQKCLFAVGFLWGIAGGLISLLTFIFDVTRAGPSVQRPASPERSLATGREVLAAIRALTNLMGIPIYLKFRLEAIASERPPGNLLFILFACWIIANLSATLTEFGQFGPLLSSVIAVAAFSAEVKYRHLIAAMSFCVAMFNSINDYLNFTLSFHDRTLPRSSLSIVLTFLAFVVLTIFFNRFFATYYSTCEKHARSILRAYSAVATAATMAESIAQYDTAALDDTLSKYAKTPDCDKRLLRCFRSISDNLKRYRPHLPNYVLREVDSRDEEGGDVDDGDSELGSVTTALMPNGSGTMAIGSSRNGPGNKRAGSTTAGGGMRRGFGSPRFGPGGARRDSLPNASSTPPVPSAVGVGAMSQFPSADVPSPVAASGPTARVVTDLTPIVGKSGKHHSDPQSITKTAAGGGGDDASSNASITHGGDEFMSSPNASHAALNYLPPEELAAHQQRRPMIKAPRAAPSSSLLESTSAIRKVTVCYLHLSVHASTDHFGGGGNGGAVPMSASYRGGAMATRRASGGLIGRRSSDATAAAAYAGGENDNSNIDSALNIPPPAASVPPPASSSPVPRGQQLAAFMSYSHTDHLPAPRIIAGDDAVSTSQLAVHISSPGGEKLAGGTAPHHRFANGGLLAGRRQVDAAYNHLVSRFHEIASATHGSIHSFVGDVMVISWGATTRESDVEQKAVRFASQAATAIQDANMDAESASHSGSGLRDALVFNAVIVCATGSAQCMFAGDQKQRTFFLSGRHVLGRAQAMLKHGVDALHWAQSERIASASLTDFRGGAAVRRASVPLVPSGGGTVLVVPPTQLSSVRGSSAAVVILTDALTNGAVKVGFETRGVGAMEHAVTEPGSALRLAGAQNPAMDAYPRIIYQIVHERACVNDEWDFASDANVCYDAATNAAIAFAQGHPEEAVALLDDAPPDAVEGPVMGFFAHTVRTAAKQ